MHVEELRYAVAYVSMCVYGGNIIKESMFGVPNNQFSPYKDTLIASKEGVK